MHPDSDVSSSDLALRYHAPTVIVAAWRGANSSFGTPSVRFGRRRGFVEIVLRYLVAVLSAEVDGQPLATPAPPAWRDLCRRLEKPTLGGWAAAAEDLSKAVLALPAPITSALAGVLWGPDGAGRLGPTPAHAALTRLIELRNMDAHDDLPSDAEAVRLLAESDAPLRAFLVALRPLRRHVIWCATRVHHNADRTIEVDLVCLRGIDPPAPRRLCLAQGLPEHVPFLVSPRGDVLLLGPLLAFAAFHVKRDPELRLLKHWKKLPLFGDPIDGSASPAPVGVFPPSAETWIAQGHAHALLTGIVPPGPTLDLLLDPDRAEAPPEVPGYVLGDRIGHGASGRVYLAHPRTPGMAHDVAVKVLDRALAADPTWRERLKREYEAMRRLRAPGVVKVYDFLEDAPAGPTIVMEYVRGRDLHATVGRGKLDVGTAVTLCEEVLAALGEAHALGIVHRDIKPSNILLDDATGRARVLDFGIARIEGDRTLTRTSDGLGTVAFAAPEQIEGRAVDGRADLYGVGRLLGYLVSGSTNPTEHAASLPGALQAVYRRATDPLPAERWPDANAFREALRKARADRWAGAPIGPEQALDPTTRIDAVLLRLEPGLWVLRGRDQGTGAVGLLVAERHEDATSALQTALQGLGEAERRALENPRLHHTPDGLRWCFLPAADPVAAARRLLASRAAPSPSVPSPTPTPRATAAPARATTPSGLSSLASGAVTLSALVASASPLGMAATLFGVAARNKSRSVAVPPYLEGWSLTEPGRTPKALAARLDELALVIHAQAHALGAPLDAEDWLALRRKPLRPASEVLTEPVGRWPALLARQLEKTSTRDRALQAVLKLAACLEAGVSEPPGRALRADVDLAAGILHSLALTGSTTVAPEKLAPWVFPGADGWCVRGDLDRHWHPLGRAG